MRCEADAWEGASLGHDLHRCRVQHHQVGLIFMPVEGGEDNEAIVLGGALLRRGDEGGLRREPGRAIELALWRSPAEVVLDDGQGAVHLRVGEPLHAPVEAVLHPVETRVDLREVGGMLWIADHLCPHRLAVRVRQEEALDNVVGISVPGCLVLASCQGEVLRKGVERQSAHVDDHACFVLEGVEGVRVVEPLRHRQGQEPRGAAVHWNDMEAIVHAWLLQVHLQEGVVHRLRRHSLGVKLDGHSREHDVLGGDSEGVHVGRLVHDDVRNALAPVRVLRAQPEQPNGRLVRENASIAHKVDPLTGDWVRDRMG
mmetsp:Transcript_46880/g.105348  ORF Transcript_46880/g.105348 Transcript_46880/m.105348 type:complete len:313 (+) Transcript_46880:400-1338(+)